MSETKSNAGDGPEGAGEVKEPKAGYLFAAPFILLYGVHISAYLALVKLRLQYDPGYESGCNYGGSFNCDKVATSEWSTFAGLPVALLAIPTYVVMAFLALFAIAKLRDPEEGAGEARTAIRFLFGIGLLSCLYSVYLAYISGFVLKTYCVHCMQMYAVNLAVTLLAWFADRGPEPLGRRLGLVVEEALAIARPTAQAAVVVVAAYLVSSMWYGRSEAALANAATAQIGAAIAAETAAMAPAPGAATGAVAPKKAPSKTAAAPPRAAAPASGSKPQAVRTENGLSYFEVPVGADDHAWGKPDAPVTIVLFSDFECGYCRILSLNMRKVKEKFKDKIRVVMKHYPMNADCNPRMGGDRMHEHACHTARAAECAGKQGKFWELHDKLYDNQQSLDEKSVEGFAQKLGVDMAKWKACLSDPATEQKIRKDIAVAGRAYIWGTPRMYINGRLVTGAAGPAIIEYYLQHALKGGAPAKPAAAEVKATTATPTQVKVSLGDKSFYIDAFEASVDSQGRALSVPGAVSAHLSWHDSKAACEKVGKRLCTEQEWVTACAGQPAEDNNNNRYFADDAVEGSMYPYGPFYEKGRCQDAEDKYEGEPVPTGSLAGCRTPTGIYDLAGNLGEWVGAEPSLAAQVGGDYRSGERASCNKRSYTFGPGIRNRTTGFRCCSDGLVKGPSVAAADVDTSSTEDIVGKPIPPRMDIKTDGDETVNPAWFKGKITYVTFFASWCGSCKRELPVLRKLQEEYRARGFRVLAIGTDRLSDRSKDFIKKYEPNYPVGFDPDSVAMGLFNIDAMPASFLVDRAGVVRHRTIGFKIEELPEMKEKIEELLGK